jgi:hypothetical protein
MSATIRFNVLDYSEFKELRKELESDPLFIQNIRDLKRIENEAEGIGYEICDSIWVHSAIDLGIIEIRSDSDSTDQRQFRGLRA